MMTTEELMSQIQALPHVTRVSLWGKAEGKERIYIETAKFNGGKTFNGGKGYATLYIDLATKKLVAQDVAGAATRDKLAPTLTTLQALAQEA